MVATGEMLETLCPIWPAQDLDLRSPNALLLDQLASIVELVTYLKQIKGGNVNSKTVYFLLSLELKNLKNINVVQVL